MLDNQAVKRTHISSATVSQKLDEKGFKNRLKGNVLVLNLSKYDFKDIYRIKEKMKELVISGVKGIEQVLVVKREKNYVILTAGSNLQDIMEVKGVNKEKTISNDLHEVAKVSSGFSAGSRPGLCARTRSRPAVPGSVAGP